jgi:predicted nucleic acid-binding Zn ribbon protein
MTTCAINECGSKVLAKGLCHKHYQNERTKRLRAEQRAVVRACQCCGAEFSGRRPNALFCSTACKDKSRKRPYVSRAAPATTGRCCRWCAAGIDDRPKQTRFCSRLCFKRHEWDAVKLARPDRHCLVCSAMIARTEPTSQRFCSADCRLLNARALRYGLPGADLHAMIATADGHCSLCGNPFNGDNHIDHCHTSGSVRGLLCSPCNTGLGQFRDNADLLRRAANYVERDSAPD